jgi:hypothetical protein
VKASLAFANQKLGWGDKARQVRVEHGELIAIEWAEGDPLLFYHGFRRSKVIPPTDGSGFATFEAIPPTAEECHEELLDALVRISNQLEKLITATRAI